MAINGPTTITGLPAAAALTGAENIPMDQGGSGLGVHATVTTVISSGLPIAVAAAAATTAIAGTELLPVDQSSTLKQTTVAQLTTQATASSSLGGTESFANVTAGGAYQKSTISQVVTAVVTQQSSNARNYFIDPSCRVAQNPGVFNLSSTYQYGQVDLVQHKATGSAVSAGTIVQINNAGPPTLTGYASRISGATITGTGIVFARRFIESVDMISLSGPNRNNGVLFSCIVQHNVGSNINYTITINNANTANNFSSTINLATSGSFSVPSGVPTLISFGVNLNSGSTNGIEMVVQGACGAVTTKNFDFTDWQATQGSNLLPLQLNPFVDDFQKALRYYEKSYEYGTVAGTASTFAGQVTFQVASALANAGTLGRFRLAMNKVTTPAVSVYNTSTGSTNSIRDSTGAANITITTSGDTVSYVITNNNGASLTDGNLMAWHYSADSRL